MRVNEPFRFWCQKVLPLVYDDSLSYYELLCKVVDYLNSVIEDVKDLSGDVTEIYKLFNDLKSYIDNYFENLDIQDEINNKLDEMVTSGVLYNYFAQYFLNGDKLSPMDSDTLQAIVDTGLTYIRKNSSFVYGHNTAYRKYDENVLPYAENPKQIDCSSFVMLLLGGVPYESSRYNANITVNTWGASGYCYKMYKDEADFNTGAYSVTYGIAKELVNRGLCFVPAKDYSNIMPGDILFYGNTDTYPERFMGIHHCEIFLGWSAYGYPPRKNPFAIVLTASTPTTDGGDVMSVHSRPITTGIMNDELVLCARVPVKVSKAPAINVNHVNMKYYNTGSLNVSLKKNEFFTIEFDGTINVAGNHFTYYQNGNGRFTTMDITGDEVGVTKHYKMNIGGVKEDVSTVRIASNDTTATIENLVVSTQVKPNLDAPVFIKPTSVQDLQNEILEQVFTSGYTNTYMHKRLIVKTSDITDFPYQKGLYMCDIIKGTDIQFNCVQMGSRVYQFGGVYSDGVWNMVYVTPKITGGALCKGGSHSYNISLPIDVHNDEYMVVCSVTGNTAPDFKYSIGNKTSTGFTINSVCGADTTIRWVIA